MMILGGLQKTTLLDYPGHVACTLFLPGCNLRCPFCHNPDLVLPGAAPPPPLTEEELMAFLRKRQGLLDGVCITGGEPTLHRELPELIRRIRGLGFQVKLDTNGSNPSMLRSLLREGLLSYVAMDIKNAPARYRETCGGADILQEVRESAALLMEGTVSWEFRTTVMKPFHDRQALEEIGRWLRGGEAYFLQPFVDSGHLVGGGVSPLSKAELDGLLQAVLPYIPRAQLRGL